MTSTQLLSPGATHPYTPLSVAALAEFVHVSYEEVQRWLDAGLPTTDAGLIDPFTCSNWLCWGHLQRCPVLARRWRTYLIFFAPFVAGSDRVRQVSWRQVRRLYTSESPEQVQWSIARSVNTDSQQRVAVEHISAADFHVQADAQWWHCTATTANPCLEIITDEHLKITPRVELSASSSDFTELCAVVREVAGTFRYEYRHHLHGDYRSVLLGAEQPRTRWSGSCLDCAMTLAALLAERNRPWRLVAGVVAHTLIANPHFWLETQITGGKWVPVDPSLPAIVRMVGGDWQHAARAWTGALDARRVTLGVVGEGLTSTPQGSTLGSKIGEAVINQRNAWQCLDWVCGDCEATFTER